MMTPERNIFYLIPSVIISLIYVSCEPREKPTQTTLICKCPIEKLADREGGNNKNESNEAWEIESGVKLEATIKKVIETKINLSGKYSNADSKIQETYWEVLGGNPQITQHANLYRTVACAYYEIICQDNTLTGKERRTELLKIVNGFEENISSIVKQSKIKQPDDGGGKTTNPNTNNEKPQPRNNNTVPTNEVIDATKYYSSSVQTDIAIFNTGNYINSNLGSLLRNYFREEDISSSTAFFRPAFKNTYGNSLKNEDITALQALGIQKNVQCVCFVNQSIGFKQNQYDNNAFQTASGDYDVKIFNLKTSDVASYSIRENGAGATDALAQESLEEKFIAILKQKFINPSLCKK